MEDFKNLNAVDLSRENCEGKNNPNTSKDVKRKLSFIQKKIGDLQRQRRFAYKNSAQVKKTVHNQINQIVRCLRARERSLWAKVDKAYLLQDENISVELSRLQSVYARCQALLDLIENKGCVNVLEKIYSILSEVKFGEKPDFKELEFVSEFEAMQSMADTFGHLNSIFLQKEGLDQAKKNNAALDLEECVNKTTLITSETDDSLNKISSKSSECDDSFEIVDLLENMCCEEIDKDLVMVEQEKCGTSIQLTECVTYTSGNPQKEFKNDFNPEEEWKQILELRSKIANFSGITSKLTDENKNFEIHNTAGTFNSDKWVEKKHKKNPCSHIKEAHSWLQDASSRNEKLFVRSYKQNKFLSSKETDYWLHSKSTERNSLKERSFEKIHSNNNIEFSPAEIIRKSFTSYLRKENIENWLLCNQ